MLDSVQQALEVWQCKLGNGCQVHICVFKAINILVILAETTRNTMWMRQTFGTCVSEAMTVIKMVIPSVWGKKRDCGLKFKKLRQIKGKD